MTKTKSRFEVYHDSIMSQRVSDENPILKKLSGTDLQISDTIAILTYFNDPETFTDTKTGKKKSGIEFMLGLLDVLRLSHLATSEKTNEITKLGFMLPKGTKVVDFRDNT